MTDTKTNKDKETLSQLMDGEWQDISPASSVKSICADDELTQTWSRYHLIRDVIRNESVSLDTSLSSRISQAIEDEPSYTNVSAISPGSQSFNAQSDEDLNVELNESNVVGIEADTHAKQKRKPGYLSTGLGGLALAACVALATVVGLNVWQQGAPTGATTQSIASVPGTINAPTNVPGVVLPEVEFVSNNGTFWVNPEAKRSAKSETRLNALLSAHIENSPTAERTGMLPYSRLVGYDTVKAGQ